MQGLQAVAPKHAAVLDQEGEDLAGCIGHDHGRARDGRAGVAEQSGVLRAAFTGNHGWFWRNRTDAPVTLTLRTRGDYSELKRTA